jgi:hypothetical protein
MFSCSTEPGDTVDLVLPFTVHTDAWIAEHVLDARRFGHALVVEHRFIRELIAGMVDNGLAVRQL